MGSRVALVTGVTGCVGRAVAAALAENGWSVRGLVRTPAPDTRRTRRTSVT